MSPIPLRGSARAFSLVEILVATAVLSVLCLILFSLIEHATRLWTAQENQENAFREVRAAFNIFSRDAANALPSTNAPWFSVATNRLAFVTALPPDSQREDDRGDLCVVGYSLEWGAVHPSDPREKECLALYRYVRFSGAAFTNTLEPRAAVSAIFDEVDGATTIRELVARNIVSFHVTPAVTNSAGDLTVLDPSAVVSAPDVLDLSLTAIGENAAAKLATQAAWADTNSAVLRPNLSTFSLRVHLRRPPPATSQP